MGTFVGVFFRQSFRCSFNRDRKSCQGELDGGGVGLEAWCFHCGDWTKDLDMFSQWFAGISKGLQHPFPAACFVWRLWISDSKTHDPWKKLWTGVSGVDSTSRKGQIICKWQWQMLQAVHDVADLKLEAGEWNSLHVAFCHCRHWRSWWAYWLLTQADGMLSRVSLLSSDVRTGLHWKKILAVDVCIETCQNEWKALLSALLSFAQDLPLTSRKMILDALAAASKELSNVKVPAQTFESLLASWVLECHGARMQWNSQEHRGAAVFFLFLPFELI